MYFSQKDIEEDIELFIWRIIVNKDYCESLYREQTIYVLALRYFLYELGLTSKFKLPDELTGAEMSWHIMGVALGHLKSYERTQGRGFNSDHELSDEGIKMADKFFCRYNNYRTRKKKIAPKQSETKTTKGQKN